MADHANVAAAVTAGYKQVTTTIGGIVHVLLEKQVRGATGESNSLTRAYGQGASQGAAETVALAALNNQRAHRYGRSGHTDDST